MSDLKEKICQLADDHKESLNNIADYIHANPELGCQEVKASAYLQELLKNEGFTVEDALKDQFPTAFKASYGNGDIHIGFLAEYDALPEIGHGCGHNLISAMSTTAAIVCGKALRDKITVHLFGCPAEETIGSKVMMSEQGVFDGLKTALICHPGSETSFGGTSYATHPLQFTFKGKPAHVADPDYHGINALDALVDFYQQLKTLEHTFTEPYILGRIITEAGTAPNIIPDKAVMKATIRALRVEYLEETMLPQIKELARKVSDRHGTELELFHYEPLFKNMLNHKQLQAYAMDNFQSLGMNDIKTYPDDYADGSTDVGNVSHVVPTIQPEIKIGDDIAAHTPEFAAAAGSQYGKDMALKAVKGMCMTVIDILERGLQK
ncbi:N-acyl-L-amino acid amidohydrolase [Anaerovibrio sp. JC8]|uniref:amidohydrolase n=1 Tax=Anaerovibrio sp. JC8 TaxID=1240085 RepID=UPI000A0B887B|nr:amidohydrolase [Anaerovibrio sp. JC8]ORT99169.1 N-acyl-L-amino acid amidohydrolase [Anaerovibrio sp. JC8]